MWQNQIVIKGETLKVGNAQAQSRGRSKATVKADVAGQRKLRQTIVDGNWAGYVLTEHPPYTSIQGTWTVPGVSWIDYPPDPFGRPIYENTSNWVGIGGDPDVVLIQLGTQQTALKSGPSNYSLWYELFPADPITIDARRFTLNAGDTITATMTCITTCLPGQRSTWILTMMNVGRWKYPFSIQVQNPNTNLASAEWIMEDSGSYNGNCSSYSCAITSFAYLPKYTATTFSGMRVNNQTSQLSPLQDVFMVADPEGKGWSVPSAPIGADSFTVSYVAPPAP
jgi:hypothetical protein